MENRSTLRFFNLFSRSPRLLIPYGNRKKKFSALLSPRFVVLTFMALRHILATVKHRSVAAINFNLKFNLQKYVENIYQIEIYDAEAVFNLAFTLLALQLISKARAPPCAELETYLVCTAEEKNWHLCSWLEGKPPPPGSDILSAFCVRRKRWWVDGWKIPNPPTAQNNSARPKSCRRC